MKITCLPAVVLLALALPLAAQDVAVSSYINLEACPAPVQEVLKKAATGGKLERVKSTTKAGVTHYTGEIDLADGRDVKIQVKPDGMVQKTVTDVLLKDAPPAIREALAKLAEGQGKIEDVEQVVSGTTTVWQAEIDREAQPDWKVKLDAAGAVLERIEEKS